MGQWGTTASLVSESQACCSHFVNGKKKSQEGEINPVLFFFFFSINLQLYFLFSYGRVYAADPYHHTLAPAATYGVGAVVSDHFLLFLITVFPISPRSTLCLDLSTVDIFSLLVN